VPDYSGSAFLRCICVLIAVILIPIPPASAQDIDDKGLAAWWPLDADLSDRVSGIALTGAEKPNFIDGAMVFNGNQALEASVPKRLDMGRTDFTLEVTLMLAKVPANYGFILSRGTKQLGGYYYLAVQENGCLRARIHGGEKDSWVITDKTPFMLDRWYHVVASFDRDEKLRVYINGQPAGKADISTVGDISNAGKIYVGGLSRQFFSGRMTGVRVYGRALSRNEAKARFAIVSEKRKGFAKVAAPVLNYVGTTRVICKQPGRYIGWPTVTRLSDDELLTVFSGDRDAHVCPFGKTQMIRSRDNGRTWSKTITINNSPLDDRSAGIIETAKGTLLLSWHTSVAFFKHIKPEWRRHADKLNQDARKRFCGSWVRRSSDGGKTWEDPIKILTHAPHGPIQLRDGRLLYMGGNHKKIRPEDSGYGASESRDDGRTWQVLGSVPYSQELLEKKRRMYSEPHVVETASGKLVAMFRTKFTKREDRRLYQSQSLDGGKTWSMPVNTGLQGYPPHLIRLKNDWLLVSYGRRLPPYGLRACISRDEGKTWDKANEILLCGAPNGDLGYPTSVQLADGSIYTVFYRIDKPGEKTCLMATHWRLPQRE